MIDRADAQRLAEAEIAAQGLGSGVSELYAWSEITFRKPKMYAKDLSDCWIAYAKREFQGLGPSAIVAIDRETGMVVYAGSAHDEG